MTATEDEEIMTTDVVVAIATDQDQIMMIDDVMVAAVTVGFTYDEWIVFIMIYFRWWPWRRQRSRWG